MNRKHLAITFTVLMVTLILLVAVPAALGGDPVGCDPDFCIEVEKSTNGQDADLPPGPSVPVGGLVTWEYVVTNTGDVRLNVDVTDDQLGFICDIPNLEGHTSATCTVTGIAMAGQYANVATATGAVVLNPSLVVSDTDPSHYFGEEPPGGEGCTPGYWKNHLEDWPPTGYAPSDSFDGVFGTTTGYTLGQAIDAKGGGIKELARHGTAGLLSAAHPDVSYPYTVAQVVAFVQAGDADTLVAANELGCEIP